MAKRDLAGASVHGVDEVGDLVLVIAEQAEGENFRQNQRRTAASSGAACLLDPRCGLHFPEKDMARSGPNEECLDIGGQNAVKSHCLISMLNTPRNRGRSKGVWRNGAIIRC